MDSNNSSFEILVNVIFSLVYIKITKRKKNSKCMNANNDTDTSFDKCESLVEFDFVTIVVHHFDTTGGEFSLDELLHISLDFLAYFAVVLCRNMIADCSQRGSFSILQHRESLCDHFRGRWISCCFF